MKRLLVLIILCSACKEIKKSETDLLIEESDKFIDSVKNARKVDSMVKATIRSAYIDTSGLENAPIKVISTRIEREDYSAFRSVGLTWKNISTKRISAVRFKWYGVNAFNEPTDMGSGFDGLGGGMADREISPGKTDRGSWSTSSSNIKKILCAWPCEVAFEDGTIWKQKQ